MKTEEDESFKSNQINYMDTNNIYHNKNKQK